MTDEQILQAAAPYMAYADCEPCIRGTDAVLSFARYLLELAYQIEAHEQELYD